MKKLRIGIMGTRGIPNHYGGFEQFAEHLSVGLVERGHDVSVYNSSLHPYTLSTWHDVSIIHCKDWEHKFGTAGQFFYDLNCINDARKRNFDILLHLGYTSDSLWSWRWPKNSVNLVNMDGLEWMRSKYNKPTQTFLKWAESIAAKRAHTMIADSPGIQKYLQAKYGRKPVYIPYGANPFTAHDDKTPSKYGLMPGKYHLVIARMEPENNIEMIIQGHLASNSPLPLFVIGNITNRFGQQMVTKYTSDRVLFSDGIYDQIELNNLRYHCALYFHGHSVGGTNPSLLEAMACGCRIVAHDNKFNRAVLHDEAYFFESKNVISEISDYASNDPRAGSWRETNLRRIRSTYNDEKIIDSYEDLMLACCGSVRMVMQEMAPGNLVIR